MNQELPALVDTSILINLINITKVAVVQPPKQRFLLLLTLRARVAADE